MCFNLCWVGFSAIRQLPSQPWGHLLGIQSWFTISNLSISSLPPQKKSTCLPFQVTITQSHPPKKIQVNLKLSPKAKATEFRLLRFHLRRLYSLHLPRVRRSRRVMHQEPHQYAHCCCTATSGIWQWFLRLFSRPTQGGGFCVCVCFFYWGSSHRWHIWDDVSGFFLLRFWSKRGLGCIVITLTGAQNRNTRKPIASRTKSTKSTASLGRIEMDWSDKNPSKTGIFQNCGNASRFSSTSRGVHLLRPKNLYAFQKNLPTVDFHASQLLHPNPPSMVQVHHPNCWTHSTWTRRNHVPSNQGLTLEEFFVET